MAVDFEDSFVNHLSVKLISSIKIIIIMKYAGGGRNAAQKFWLFPSMQCSGDVENRGKAGMH